MLKNYCFDLEETASRQLDELVASDIFGSEQIAIMPDAHTGAGCVIGFTAKVTDKVVPNLVGVDIGCGMLAQRLPAIEDKTALCERIDVIIRKAVPSGFAIHPQERTDSQQHWGALLPEKLKCYEDLSNQSRYGKSVGTLGGGNHFIEINEDSQGELWLVVHSGSRNLGLQVAEYYQRQAEASCDELLPKDLRYLTGKLAEDYLHDMRLCQEYAEANRREIASAIAIGLRIDYLGHEIESVHNYIDHDGMIRKGACSAQEGQELIIPMNMAFGILRCVGKGNPEWNYSAPHGAGRRLSRSKAKKDLTMDAYEKSMGGVYSTCVTKDTLDEAPMAYKPPDTIINAIGATVEIVDIWKPIYNYKAK